MRRLLSVVALWAAFSLGANAQIGGLSFPGPGPVVSSGATYVGPGDIQSGWLVWYGSRCFSNAYSGNVADVVDSLTGNTTGTRLQCASGVVSALVSASACTFVTGNACSILATTCAVACKVVTAYDQSGANSCSSAPCNATQATNASRPVFITSCQNSHPCMQFAGSQNLQATPGITTSQPLFASWVAIRTGAFTSFGGVLSLASSGTPQFTFGSSANQVECYAGTALDVNSIPDSAFHAVQVQVNGASSAMYIDGTNHTGNCGTGNPAGGLSVALGSSPFSQFLTGEIAEAGAGTGSSATNQSTLNTNQHTYWSF